MPDIALMEWLSVLLRWAHVVVALVWIGTSFYLISWENKFNRELDLREGVAGDFWTIQGGDFYFVEKLDGAPRRLPQKLHWFKYEAYFTWLTGFALMGLIYYARDPVLMLDHESPLHGSAQAIAASLVLLASAWLAYSVYCRTSVARNLPVTAVLGVGFVALLAWMSGWLFNGRAGMLHVGAALGTIMSANVYFVIIPWQKRLVQAIGAGRDPAEIYREHPGFRSRHNHYLALPVLFLMLAIHAPINYDGPLNWLVVVLLVLSMGLLKHYHTCIQRGRKAWPMLVTGLLVFAGAVLCDAVNGSDLVCRDTVATAQIEGIFEKYCDTCHAAGQPPKLAGPVEWLAYEDRIRERVVRTQSMPPGNGSGIPGAERNAIACWLEQHGAS